MEIKVAASSKPGYAASQEELNKFAGMAAGVCYMPQNFEALKGELVEKTIKRAVDTKTNGHHSVFGHGQITLELEGIPKLFAMLLNNENIYNTSEKSARYTNMELTGETQFIYDKWYNKFLKLITEKYGHIPYFSATRIKKLAMENARYFTSVMTPTSMVHTVSYQQLNYMCGWMQQFENSENKIYRMLAPTAKEFVERVDRLGYLDAVLMKDGKNRGFSLVGKRAREEQFGESYSVNYKASFAMLAQAQRHRTLDYELMQDENPEYFIPLIFEGNDSLIESWLEDMKKVAHTTPQGELVHINEQGKYENLILKAKERLCTAAQLEIMQATKETMDRYIKNTNIAAVKADLGKVANGSRCKNGFKCQTPCGFLEGINGDRLI